MTENIKLEWPISYFETSKKLPSLKDQSGFGLVEIAMTIGVLSVAAIAISYSLTFLRNRPSAVQAAATELAQSAIQAFTSSGQVGRALDPYIPGPTPPQAFPTGFLGRGILPDDTRILVNAVNTTQAFIPPKTRSLVFPTTVPVSTQLFAAGRQRRFVDFAAIGETGSPGYIAPAEPTPAGVSSKIVATSNAQLILNVANLAQAMYNCGWTGSACTAGLPDFCTGNDSTCPQGGIDITSRVFSPSELSKAVKSVCLRIRPFNLSTNQEYPAGTCPRPLVSGPRGMVRNSQRLDSRYAAYVNADVNLGYKMTAVATLVGSGNDGQLKDIIGQASFVAAHVSDRTPPGRPQNATVTDGANNSLSTQNWTVCNEMGPTPAAVANYNQVNIRLPFSPATGNIEPGVVALCRTYTRHSCRPTATDWVVSNWHPCDQLRFEYTDGVVPGYDANCGTTASPGNVVVNSSTVAATGGGEGPAAADPRLDFQTNALLPEYHYNVEYTVIDPAGNKSPSQCINTAVIDDASEFPCRNGPGFFVDSMRPIISTQAFADTNVGPPEDGIAGRDDVPVSILPNGFNWGTTAVQCNSNSVSFTSTVAAGVSIAGIPEGAAGCHCLPAGSFSSCNWVSANRRCEAVYNGGGTVGHGLHSVSIFPRDNCSIGTNSAGPSVWENHTTAPAFFAGDPFMTVNYQSSAGAPHYPLPVTRTLGYAAENYARWAVQCDCSAPIALHTVVNGVPGGAGLTEQCASTIDLAPQGCTSASLSVLGVDVCGRTSSVDKNYQVYGGLGDPCGTQRCSDGLECATSSQYLSTDATPSRITGICYAGGGSVAPIGSAPPNANPVCPVRGPTCVSTAATSANNSNCAAPISPVALIDNGMGSGVHTHASNRQYAISTTITPWTNTRSDTWSCRWAGTKTVYIDQKETRYCHDTLVIPKQSSVADVVCSAGACESGRGTCPNPTPGNAAAGSLCVLGSTPNVGCIDSPTPPPLSGYAYVVVGGVNYVDPAYSGVPLDPTPPGGFTYGYPMVTPGGTATFKWYALNEDPGASYLPTELGSMVGIRNSTDNTAVYSSGVNRLQYLQSPGGNEQWYLMDAANFLPWSSVGVERSVAWTVPSDYLSFTAPHVQGGSYTNAVVVLRFKPKGFNGQQTQWGAGISIPTPTPAFKHYAFVTTRSYSSNLSGAEGADVRCQIHADQTPLLAGRTFKAYISTESVNAKDRISDYSPWTMVNDVQVFPSYNHLVSPTGPVVALKTENDAAPGMGQMFTGTTNTGLKHSGYTCNSWTTTSGSYNRSYAVPVSGSFWNPNGSTACSSGANHLICLEQPPAPTPTPAVKRYVFVTSTLHNSNFGGVAAANTICQNLANSAGGVLAGRTFEAWISTSTTNAISSISDYSPWYLRTGQLVFKTYADLTDAAFYYPIVTDENGAAVSENWPNVWTGTDIGGVASSNTCSNWTSTSGWGTAGTVGSTSWGFSAGSIPSCGGNSYRLICFEQPPVPTSTPAPTPTPTPTPTPIVVAMMNCKSHPSNTCELGSGSERSGSALCSVGVLYCSANNTRSLHQTCRHPSADCASGLECRDDDTDSIWLCEQTLCGGLNSGCFTEDPYNYYCQCESGLYCQAGFYGASNSCETAPSCTGGGCLPGPAQYGYSCCEGTTWVGPGDGSCPIGCSSGCCE